MYVCVCVCVCVCVYVCVLCVTIDAHQRIKAVASSSQLVRPTFFTSISYHVLIHEPAVVILTCLNWQIYIIIIQLVIYMIVHAWIYMDQYTCFVQLKTELLQRNKHPSLYSRQYGTFTYSYVARYIHMCGYSWKSHQFVIQHPVT